MKLSVVIAAYDEVANIEPLTRRLAASLATIPECSWELIFAVEGEDGTHEALQRLAPEIAGMRILYRREPAGLGAAFRRAFAAVAADADYVVTMDADLNHQPEEIPRLLAAARRLDTDVLVGSRFVSGSEVEGIPFWKRSLSGAINRLMSRLFGLRVRDKTSGFRIYRAAVLRRLRYHNDAFAFLPELLIRAGAAGYRVGEEPIHFRYRRSGQSKMALWPTSVSYLSLLRGAFDSWTWAALALLGLGVALRVATAFPSHKYPADADCVLPGLAALRLLNGHPPVFFGSLRIGAVGSYLLALLFALFGVSRTTLATGPAIVDVALLVVWYLFLRELLGSRLALLGLPFAAVPPPAFTFWTYMPNGYPETLLFCATTLWLAARLARGDERRWTVFALGLSLGLGWWNSPQTLGCALPALLWLAWRRPRLFARPQVVPLAVLALLLGVLPWIAFNVRYGLASLHDNFAIRPARGLAAVLDNGRDLVTDKLPEMIASTDPEKGLNPANAVQLMLRLPTILISAGAVLFALAIAPLLRRRARATRRLDGSGGGGRDAGDGPDLPAAVDALAGHAAAERERQAWPLFVLLVLVNVALNLFSGAGELRGLTVRYVLPLYLIVPALLGLSLARVAVRSRAFAGLLAGAVLLFNAAGTFWPWTPTRQRWAANGASDERMLHLFERQRVTAVLGPYWLVYPINFFSHEKILGIPLEANADYRHEIERLPRTPLRWALVGYSAAELQRWARRAGIDGAVATLSRPSALVLPNSDLPAEQFWRRMSAAWEERFNSPARDSPAARAAAAAKLASGARDAMSAAGALAAPGAGRAAPAPFRSSDRR